LCFEPLQNRHRLVCCPVVLPLQVHAKVDQHRSDCLAERRNIRAGPRVPTLPSSYFKGMRIVCSPPYNSIQHRNALMITHQRKPVVNDLLGAQRLARAGKALGGGSTSKAWKRQSIVPSGRTDAGSWGANTARGQATRRASAGWRGDDHGDIPVASEDVPRVLSWSTRCPVYAKANSLRTAGSRSTRLCRCPLPRDQIRWVRYVIGNLLQCQDGIFLRCAHETATIL
jgi:hypothetical protein